MQYYRIIIIITKIISHFLEKIKTAGYKKQPYDFTHSAVLYCFVFGFQAVHYVEHRLLLLFGEVGDVHHHSGGGV